MGLLQVVVYTAASKLDSQSPTEQAITSSQDPPANESSSDPHGDSSSTGAEPAEPSHDDKNFSDGLSLSNDQKNVNIYDIFMKLPQIDLHNLCSLLGHEGLSNKVYLLNGEVLKKLAYVAPSHQKFFIAELSDIAHSLHGSAVRELITLRDTHMLGLSLTVYYSRQPFSLRISLLMSLMMTIFCEPELMMSASRMISIIKLLVFGLLVMMSQGCFSSQN